MSRLLLLLSLIGAAIYALLAYTHDVLTDEKAEKTYAEQTQPKQPVEHVSSWDTYLPDRSSNQNPKLATSLSAQVPPQQSDEPSQNSERNADQVATSENNATSLGTDDAEPKPVELAKVVLGAQTIESPTRTQVATDSTTESPTLISPKSNKRHRSAKHAAHGVAVANADPWNARWARRADRRRGFGLFMFRPVPRFAQR
jgi:hypothetical protein